MKQVLLITLFISAFSAQMIAQKPGVVLSKKAGWHKIGETVVNFKAETDEIVVLGADRFSFLKIKVEEAPIYLTSFQIYFEDGNAQSADAGMEIKAAGETEIVKLTGGEQHVKKVVFRYRTAEGHQDKRARVELWGLKSGSEATSK